MVVGPAAGGGVDAAAERRRAVAAQRRGQGPGVVLVLGVGARVGRPLHALGRVRDRHRRVALDLDQAVVEPADRVMRIEHLLAACPSPATAVAGTARPSLGRRSRCCGSSTPGTRWRSRSSWRAAAARGAGRWRPSASSTGPARCRSAPGSRRPRRRSTRCARVRGRGSRWPRARRPRPARRGGPSATSWWGSQLACRSALSSMPLRSPRGRASSAPVSELVRNKMPSCPDSWAALTTVPSGIRTLLPAVT